MTYPIHTAPGIYVDHEALENLAQQCGAAGGRIALVGFGEYAKHLINLKPDNIVAVYDPDPRYRDRNMRFRAVPVVDLPTRVEADLVLGCEYRHVYDYMGQVIRALGWPRYYYPPRLHYEPTAEINVFEQERLYQSVLKNEADAPISMMSGEKIRFLLELLRTGLAVSPSANILEMGSWQGGSSWFIARTLRYLNQTRVFYMMDLFERHMMDPTATMCTDEIAIRMNEVYDRVEMIVGLVDDPACLARVRGPLCFAHIDLGWQEPGLAFAWDNLLPGSPLLLDNYGHLGAPTWRFDDFFEARGTRVTRLPWSEQGFVLKR